MAFGESSCQPIACLAPIKYGQVLVVAIRRTRRRHQRPIVVDAERTSREPTPVDAPNSVPIRRRRIVRDRDRVVLRAFFLASEPDHPYVAAWWPPGHWIGYEHGFTHQVVDLVNAIAEGSDPTPSFADGLQIQKVLAAVEDSATAHAWRDVPA